MNDEFEFSAGDIVEVLQALDIELGKRNIKGNIIVAGGAAMLLAFNSRASTVDIDGIFQPAKEMRTCIKAISEDMGISSDWLNDGVKGFFDARSMPTVPLLSFEHLSVERPDDESLLAMKLTAARDNEKDMTDSTVLMRALVECF